MTPTTRFVSTGSLPDVVRVGNLVEDAHRRFRDNVEGSLSTVYPVLQRADPAHFGLCVASARGDMVEAGDVDVPFSIMSVAKPFVLALVCEALGDETVRRRIGVNATGLPFNSLIAIERSPDGRTNPMVNPGAIATAGMVPGDSLDERWQFVLDGMSRFAGRPLALADEVYASAIESNHRNRAIAELLHSLGALDADPLETVELYTRQSSLETTARDLAVLGATLANGGTNPLTGERVVSSSVCHDVMVVMTTAGMYDTSGDWLWDVGLPGKSGIGGGIVTVSPGKGGLGVFSPLLDAAGNSVRGQLASAFLSTELGLDLFATSPAAPTGGT